MLPEVNGSFIIMVLTQLPSSLLIARIQLAVRGPRTGVRQTLVIRNILTSEGGAGWWCRPGPIPERDVIPPLTRVAAG